MIKYLNRFFYGSHCFFIDITRVRLVQSTGLNNKKRSSTSEAPLGNKTDLIVAFFNALNCNTNYNNLRELYV